MKCVCKKTCQLRMDDGKIWLINAGMVIDIENLPKKNFVSLEAEGSYEIDYTTASEDELLEAKWKFSAAYEAVFNEYNVKLKKGGIKADVVKQILDARYRSTKDQPANFPGAPAKNPLAED